MAVVGVLVLALDADMLRFMLMYGPAIVECGHHELLIQKLIQHVNVYQSVLVLELGRYPTWTTYCPSVSA